MDFTRIAYATREYRHLRGLVGLLFGPSFIAWGLWLNGWLPPLPLGGFGLTLATFGLALVASSFARRYYDRRVGVVRPTEEQRRRDFWLALVPGSLALASQWIPPSVLDIEHPLGLVWIVLAAYWCFDAGPRAYIRVLAALAAAIGAVFLSGALPVNDEQYAGLLVILTGCLIVAQGWLDHLFLVHHLGKHKEVPHEDAL